MPRCATPKPRAPAAPPEQPYDRNFWKQFSPEQIAKGLEAFDDSERVSLHEDWLLLARDEQLPPPGDWRIWLFLGGRGAGKTRSGAEWIAEGVDEGAMLHIGLIGATHNDARAVMIEGVSGLLKAAPGASYEPSNRRASAPNPSRRSTNNTASTTSASAPTWKTSSATTTSKAAARIAWTPSSGPLTHLFPVTKIAEPKITTF